MKSFETFEKEYEPIDQGDECILLETYGKDWDKVKKVRNRKLWTLLDCDGKLIIVAGFRYVNRKFIS